MSSALIYSSSDDIPTHKAAKTGVTYPYYKQWFYLLFLSRPGLGSIIS